VIHTAAGNRHTSILSEHVMHRGVIPKWPHRLLGCDKSPTCLCSWVYRVDMLVVFDIITVFVFDI